MLPCVRSLGPASASSSGVGAAPLAVELHRPLLELRRVLRARFSHDPPPFPRNGNGAETGLDLSTDSGQIHSENGAALSGGERQRLSIARALLKDAPVILLDEATASLDPKNETLIQRAVGTLCAGKTVIVIAHRLRTIANADKIVVLDDGNIVEEGTHDDLVSSNGLYRHLWDLQLRSSSWGANGRMAAEGTQ